MADDPPALRRMDPSAHRVYDALVESDKPLSRAALQDETHHAGRTVRAALATLRRAGLVEREASWPVPKYALAE